MSDRIPCINKRCKRTAPAEKHPDSDEIICGKCFRSLPVELRADHKRCWREINKYRRQIARTGDEIKNQRLKSLMSKWAFRLDGTWRKIRAHIEEPESPAGLDAFLNEIGMG